MPKPELYVIFTGEKPKNPPDTISLSKDFFGGEKIAVDAEVKVLYQEDENNIIGQYIIFCKVYNEQRNMGKQRLKGNWQTHILNIAIEYDGKTWHNNNIHEYQMKVCYKNSITFYHLMSTVIINSFGINA